MTEPFERDAPQFFVRIDTDQGEQRILTNQPEGAGDPAADRPTKVLSFEYQDRESKADLVKLSIDNWDLTHLDDPIWKKGQAIIVSWGYPGRMAPERRCIVTSVKGFTTLQIEARAESVLLNTLVKCRLFENVSRANVVRQIARENGYDGNTLFVQDTSPVMESISQARLTDAQFLRRLARLEGFEFYVDFDGLHWHERQVGQRPVREFIYYTDPRFGEILSIDIENDITAKPGRTRLRGRDPVNGEDIDEDSGTSNDDDRGALASILELIDPDTGDATIEQRVQSEDTRPTSQGDAEAVRAEARGRHRRHQQTAVKLKVNATGDPTMLAKTVVQLRGAGRRLSVRYYVKEVKHSLSGTYTMEMRWISDGHGGHDTSSRRARGVDLLDPGPAQNGQQNQQDAPEENDPTEQGPRPLAILEEIDPDTGRPRLRYRDTAAQRTLSLQEGQELVAAGEAEVVTE